MLKIRLKSWAVREVQGDSKFIRMFNGNYKFHPCPTEIANQTVSTPASMQEMRRYFITRRSQWKIIIYHVTKENFSNKLFHLHLKNILLASCSQLTIIPELFALTESFSSISWTEFKATASTGISERKPGFQGSLMTRQGTSFMYQLLLLFWDNFKFSHNHWNSSNGVKDVNLTRESAFKFHLHYINNR